MPATAIHRSEKAITSSALCTFELPALIRLAPRTIAPPGIGRVSATDENTLTRTASKKPIFTLAAWAISIRFTAL